jgi:predicted metal-dependent HD superfamily phosphohydrolase
VGRTLPALPRHPPPAARARRVDELAAHAEDLSAVQLTAWYHDAVYRGAPDDEARSAQRAHTELTTLGLDPAVVAEVTRLERLTATHHPHAEDVNGQVLCGADLAILAATAEDYARYTAAVRAEYAHVSDDQFRAGLTAVLGAVLDGPSMFATPEGRRRWETAAQTNLAALTT